jgi:hypothetical protein
VAAALDWTARGLDLTVLGLDSASEDLDWTTQDLDSPSEDLAAYLTSQLEAARRRSSLTHPIAAPRDRVRGAVGRALAPPRPAKLALHRAGRALHRAGPSKESKKVEEEADVVGHSIFRLGKKREMGRWWVVISPI